MSKEFEDSVRIALKIPGQLNFKEVTKEEMEEYRGVRLHNRTWHSILGDDQKWYIITE